MNTEKKTTGSTAAGENTSTASSNPTAEVTGASASGNVPVASPADAKAGEPQAGNLGAPAASGADQVREGAGYALKVTKNGHTHQGKAVQKGQTIMLDMAEYRWALDNKVGEPGNAEHAGLPVDKKGEVISPETETPLAELEAKASKKEQKEQEG